MVTYILHRCIAESFYRLYAGFFLVVLLICLGFLGGREHMALAQFFTATPFTALAPGFLWLLYTLMADDFNGRWSHREDMLLLYEIPLAPPATRWMAIAFCTGSQLIPAAVYGAFVSIIGLRHEQVLPVSVLALSLGLCWTFLTLRLHHHLSHPVATPASSGWRTGLTLPVHILFLRHLLHSEPMLLLGTKVFSCLLWMGTLYLYTTDTYDARLLFMGATVVAAAQTGLVFAYHQLENVQLVAWKSLPLPRRQRGIMFTISLGLLLIPECVVLFRMMPPHLLTAALLFPVFILTSCFAGYGYLFRKEIVVGDFLQPVLFTMLIVFVAVLFHVPVWLLCGIATSFGVHQLNKYFYRFEPLPKAKNQTT